MAKIQFAETAGGTARINCLVPEAGDSLGTSKADAASAACASSHTTLPQAVLITQKGKGPQHAAQSTSVDALAPRRRCCAPAVCVLRSHGRAGPAARDDPPAYPRALSAR